MAKIPFSITLLLGSVLIVGCSGTFPTMKGEENSTSSAVLATTNQAVSTADEFQMAIDYANEASRQAALARTPEDWQLVSQNWLQAIQAMQNVPMDSPKRLFSQRKIQEYVENLKVSLQKSPATGLQVKYPSFNSQGLDFQILLYLSYVSAVGTPDVLVVGSSRALQGVDPGQLQAALAAKGMPGLKVFNFSVNGATAQVVDFKLRQLLSQEQLPKMIIWADGLRAFNSGRSDRTFDAIVASAGYKSLSKGQRPNLSFGRSKIVQNVENSPDISAQGLDQSHSAMVALAHPKAGSQVKLASTAEPFSYLLLAGDDNNLPPEYTMAMGPTNSFTSNINAQGFLPVETRFNPTTYYSQFPRVAGLYDGDYRPFSLAGKQAVALNSVQAFAKQRGIPLVVVNLPLSQDYLDATRQRSEQQFNAWMQQRAKQQGFVFLNLNRSLGDRHGEFADPSHLNRFGAASVAKLIAANNQIPWQRLKN